MSITTWFPQLPVGWSVKRLKRAVTLRTTRGEGTSRDDSYLGLENIASWTGRYVPSVDQPSLNELDSDQELTTCSAFVSGDVLFGKLRPYLAKALLADRDGICTTEILVLIPGECIDPRYLHRLLLTPDFVRLVDAGAYGAKMPRADWTAIGNIQIPIPPLDQQRRIADYLDAETAQIDALIAEKTRMLALLDEKRQALVSQAVTRGLDPTAPMKPSGLEWLGEVPAHWEIRRCASLFTEIDERNQPDLPLLNVSLNTGVTLRVFSSDRIESVAEDFATYKVAAKDSLVFNKMRFWQGAGGIAPVDGLTSPDYTVARISGELYPRYVEELVRLSLFSAEVRRYSHGMVDDRLRLYWDEFKNIRIPLPPYEEQQAIVTALDAERAKTAELRASLERSLDLLRERRGAVIAAAVTGQLDMAPVA